MATGPLDPGFLQHVVNVHWGGGLAVEFGEKDQDAPAPHDDSKTDE